VKATSHSWTWIFTEDRMAVWNTKCTTSPLTPTFTSMPSPIITHPISKRCYLLLIHRARALCDEDSWQAEFVFLKDVFKENGYND
jgi:hypothetical protein